MSLWVCAGCTCRYSVGAPRCPECGRTDRTDMPKAHKDRPATYATGGVVDASTSLLRGEDGYETVTIEGGDESSLGSSFETSPEPTASTGAKSSSDDSDQKPARTAGRRRKKSEG